MIRHRIVALVAALAALTLWHHTAVQAAPVVFTIDTTGGANGLTPIANTSGNVGKYNAGSWLTMSGSLKVDLRDSKGASQFVLSGNFATQSGQGASGSFPTGNPGSLVSYYNGSVLADVTDNSISFPGGSSLNAGLYTSKYPQAGHAPVALQPAIGGGVSGTPGSNFANYGMQLTLTYLGFITAESGPAAFRDSVFDLAQVTGVSGQTLTGSLGNQSFTTNGKVGIGLSSGTLDANLKGANVLGTQLPDFIASAAIGTNPVTITQSTGAAGSLTRTVTSPNHELWRLTIPVKSTLVTVDTAPPDQDGNYAITTTTITMTGQIAAYAIVATPEPATNVMLALGGTIAGWQYWRRRRAAR